jgi:hypothetical protein
MHRLSGLYAQRFNRRHGRKGHLYDQRLKNPVRAGICKRVEDWLWSWASSRSAA